MKYVMIALSLIPFLTGCSVYNKELVIAPLSPSGYSEKPIAVSSGQSYSIYFFGFIGPFGDSSIDQAISNAKSNTEADAMINVFAERRVLVFPSWFFPLYTHTETRISGTLVKYTDKDGKAVIGKSTQFLNKEVSKSQEIIPIRTINIAQLQKGSIVLVRISNSKQIVGEFLSSSVDQLRFKIKDGSIFSVWKSDIIGIELLQESTQTAP